MNISTCKVFSHQAVRFKFDKKKSYKKSESYMCLYKARVTLIK